VGLFSEKMGKNNGHYATKECPENDMEFKDPDSGT